GTIYEPSLTHAFALASWLRRAYPVSTVTYWLHSPAAAFPASAKTVDGTSVLTKPNCKSVNAYLLQRYFWFAYNFSSGIRALALVDDGGGFMRGCAAALVASGPAGSSNWGWDFDGSYADWYGGHELGHTYFRPHTK